MSLDRSLKTGGSLIQHRSVLTRAERIMKMMETGDFKEEENPLGLPKMVCRRTDTGKKKKEKSEEAEGTEVATEESTES